MKVCTDSWQNNEKATVLQFKMGDFIKTSGFSSFCQIFVKNEILIKVFQRTNM